VYSFLIVNIAPRFKYGKSLNSSDNDKNLKTQKTAEEQPLSVGVHQFLTHNYSGSLNQFKNYLNRHPLDHFVWYLLGETQLRTGNFEGAVISFRKAINLYKKRGLYFKGVGISFYYQNKYPEAADALKHAIQLGKNDSLCFTLLGVCNVYLNRIDESEMIFKQALQKNPNNPLAIYFSSQNKIKRGETKEAYKDLKKVINFQYHIPLKTNVKKLIQSIQI